MERTEYAESVEYKLNGRLHREDGPAIEFVYGKKEWYRDGKLHREDGPAIEFADGSKKWYRDGELHREDGPAIESASYGVRFDQASIYKYRKNNLCSLT